MSREERELLINCTRRLEVLIKQFILQAPEFPGDTELASAMGYEWADLECKVKGL